MTQSLYPTVSAGVGILRDDKLVAFIPDDEPTVTLIEGCRSIELTQDLIEYLYRRIQSSTQTANEEVEE